MNQGLKAQIHRYAENREIDYMSAKNLGNAYGINFQNEQELVEFKTLIDKYLKTFNEDAFQDIEEACTKKDGTGNRQGNRDGSGPGMLRRKYLDNSSPVKKTKKKSKKEIEEDYDVEVYAGSGKAGEIKLMGGHVKPKTIASVKSKKKKKSVKESKTLADMFKVD